MIFKLAGSTDLDIILSIQKRAFQNLYHKYMDEDTSPYTESIDLIRFRFNQDNYQYFLLLSKDREYIGFVGIQQILQSSVIRIAILAIDEKFQNNGYGSTIVKKIKEMFPNAIAFELDTIWEEKNLVHFYEKNGFKQFGGLRKIQEKMNLVSMRDLVSVSAVNVSQLTGTLTNKKKFLELGMDYEEMEALNIKKHKIYGAFLENTLIGYLIENELNETLSVTVYPLFEGLGVYEKLSLYKID